MNPIEDRRRQTRGRQRERGREDREGGREDREEDVGEKQNAKAKKIGRGRY